MAPAPIPQFYRESHLVGVKGKTAGLLPFSSATLWRKVKAGTFPRPVKLGAKVTAWRAAEVQAWMEALK